MADQLTSDELRQVLAEWLRPMRPKHRQKILGLAGLFEAVIARAETAETEARDARDARNDLDDAELHLRRAEAAATVLAARVAELEAQLAAQWRPVTEKPVADDEYLVWCSSYGGCEIQSYSSRLNRWYGNADNDADYWRPLPPAPQETTR
jgi:hypothetical protein